MGRRGHICFGDLKFTFFKKKKKIPNLSFLLEYNPPPKILHPVFYSIPIKKLPSFRMLGGGYDRKSFHKYNLPTVLISLQPTSRANDFLRSRKTDGNRGNDSLKRN